MAYRFTNTDKWNDGWFSSLKTLEKLLFIYLCDNCDIAGIIEINAKRIALDLGCNENDVKGAIEGLSRGITLSLSGDCAIINNFIKHQKNLPLNKLNNAHKGIISRFEMYKHKFNYNDIYEFLSAPKEGLKSPIGKGNGKGNGKNVDNVNKEKTWRNDYSIYLSELNSAIKELLSDNEWKMLREKFLPNVDIKLSLEKAYRDFWGTEAGWHHKKKSKSQTLDWKRTLNTAIELNKVYKQR